MDDIARNNLKLPNIFITDILQSSSSMTSIRIPTCYKICIILKNCGYLLYRGSEMKLTQGDIFVLFPNVPYVYWTNKNNPWNILLIEMNGNQCQELFISLGTTIERPFIFGALSDDTKRYLKDINDIISAKKRNSLAIIAATFQLLHFLTKNNRTNSFSSSLQLNPTKQAIKYIQENYHMHIDVSMICNYVGYSRSYFSRCFKKQVGMSISEYINHTRIERAKYLLKSTDLFVVEISKLVGFLDPFYFSKCFKKYTGYSPSEYIERNKNKSLYKNEN